MSDYVDIIIVNFFAVLVRLIALIYIVEIILRHVSLFKAEITRLSAKKAVIFPHADAFYGFFFSGSISGKCHFGPITTTFDNFGHAKSCRILNCSSDT